MARPSVLAVLPVIGLVACGALSPAPPATSAPCFSVQGSSALRTKDAQKTVDELAARIRLSPEDEALRDPKSIEDLRAILRHDTIYLFGKAAAFARTLDSVEGRVSEATLELLLGESQLVASQVLAMQAAWVSGDLRVARASLASDRGEPVSDRDRMLAQLIRVVEEGNAIADALGAVAPAHIARGAEVIRRLRKEAPSDVRTSTLVAEYHRLRGEWPEFEAALSAAEAQERGTPALCYLRAMEQLERFRRPDRGATLMRECLARYPHFVRAQAALVLMGTTPRAALRELAKLKQMNQDHYLVMLLEPTLAADQELGRMQQHGDDGDAPR